MGAHVPAPADRGYRGLAPDELEMQTKTVVEGIKCKRKTGCPLIVSDVLTCPPIPGLSETDEVRTQGGCLVLTLANPRNARENQVSTTRFLS